MSAMMSSSIASWTRSLQKQDGAIRQSKARARQTGGASVGQVPVQRGDESPGAALLLQQPAHSCCFAVLTRSQDHGLQHVHLKYDEGRTVSRLIGLRQASCSLWFQPLCYAEINHILAPASYLKE